MLQAEHGGAASQGTEGPWAERGRVPDRTRRGCGQQARQAKDAHRMHVGGARTWIAGRVQGAQGARGARRGRGAHDTRKAGGRASRAYVRAYRARIRAQPRTRRGSGRWQGTDIARAGRGRVLEHGGGQACPGQGGGMT